MLYSKVLFLALAAVAAATPTKRNPPPASSCSTGPVQCCNTVQNANTFPVSILLNSLGITGVDGNVPVGVTCSPISVVGVGSGATCSGAPVCCNNNSFNGVVALGCVIVDLGA